MAESEPRFVFASDSLKGTLSSCDTARLLKRSARKYFPGCSCVGIPMADGGEGTAEVLARTCDGRMTSARAHDPLGRPMQASYALLPEGRAVIETAAASGLTLLTPLERDPLRTSSYGTGELIADALSKGAREIIIALGGSATNDGGMGLVRALGVRFLDEAGHELAGCGADLERVHSIDATRIRRLCGVRFRVLCDVDNPLTGPLGASRVFAAQKGASPQAIGRLEAGMQNYAAILEHSLDFDALTPGAGAAGGIGAACFAFLRCSLERGIDCVLELSGFAEKLAGVALCVTGEGRLDTQTAHGKVVAGVAGMCAQAQVPCVAVVGSIGHEGAGALQLPYGVRAAIPTVDAPMELTEALARADELYAAAADRLFSLLAVGSLLGKVSG